MYLFYAAFNITPLASLSYVCARIHFLTLVIYKLLAYLLTSIHTQYMQAPSISLLILTEKGNNFLEWIQGMKHDTTTTTTTTI